VVVIGCFVSGLCVWALLVFILSGWPALVGPDDPLKLRADVDGVTDAAAPVTGHPVAVLAEQLR
jgi:hypothetical protein